MAEIWGRMPKEKAKPFEAFTHYLMQSPRLRTIHRAYRASLNLDLDNTEIKAPPYWKVWSSKFKWLARAMAYDDYLKAKDLEKWEERRLKARERDWDEAEMLRDIVRDALPSATQFFRRHVGQPQGGQPTIINADGQVIQQGQPAQVIVTVALDVKGLSSVLVDASKMQRLTVDEPTDNINNLTGAALDNALERALSQLALDGITNGDETGNAQGSPGPTGPQYEEQDEEWDSDEGDSVDGGADPDLE